MIPFPYYEKPEVGNRVKEAMDKPLSLNIGHGCTLRLFQIRIKGNWHLRLLVVRLIQGPLNMKWKWFDLREIYRRSSICHYLWQTITGGRRLRNADLILIAAIQVAIMWVLFFNILINLSW